MKITSTSPEHGRMLFNKLQRGDVFQFIDATINKWSADTYYMMAPTQQSAGQCINLTHNLPTWFDKEYSMNMVVRVFPDAHLVLGHAKYD